MTYRSSPSIADRMRVLEFKSSLLKQGGADPSATASMPGQVSPPMTPPPAPDMGMGEPMPEEMNAATTGKVYADNQEAMMDVHDRLTQIAVDLTAHIGTVDMQATMDNLQPDKPDVFAEHIVALRDRVESLATIVKVIRGQNPEMLAHGLPGMDGGMPPEMGGLQNMPEAGPAGMPPGGMPMPGPMMGGM